jgi:hypothetical protein
LGIIYFRKQQQLGFDGVVPIIQINKIRGNTAKSLEDHEQTRIKVD